MTERRAAPCRPTTDNGKAAAPAVAPLGIPISDRAVSAASIGHRAGRAAPEGASRRAVPLARDGHR
eukprot:scaffold27137_cov121-Isochrysis_galbana.AAC.3